MAEITPSAGQQIGRYGGSGPSGGIDDTDAARVSQGPLAQLNSAPFDGLWCPSQGEFALCGCSLGHPLNLAFSPLRGGGVCRVFDTASSLG